MSFDGREKAEVVEVGKKVVKFKEKFNLPADLILPPDTVAALEMVRREDVVIRPVVTEVPTEEDISRWRAEFLKCFKDKDRADRVCDALLKNLRRIDERTFENALIHSFVSATSEISRDEWDRGAYIYYSGGRPRSNVWVLDILRDRLPEDSRIEIPLVDSYTYKGRDNYDVGFVVDDASYSGSQICDHMKNGVKMFGMKKFNIIVPFITNKAISEIEEEANRLEVEVKFYTDEIIPTVKEVLGDDDFRWLRDITEKSSRCTDEQGLTYFAHKRPDEKSFSPHIGNTRHIEMENRIRSLVEKKPAVYHNDYLSDLRKRGLI